MVVVVVVLLYVDDGTCRKLLIEKEKNKKKNALCSRRVSSLETGWVSTRGAMRCEDESVDWIGDNSTVADEIYRQAAFQRWQGGTAVMTHVVDNNFQFLGEFVFERVGFDGC